MERTHSRATSRLSAVGPAGDKKPAYVTAILLRLTIRFFSRPRIRPCQKPEIYGLDVCENGAQASSAGALFHEMRLDDGLSDDRMQVFFRRTGLLESENLLRAGG
ncbi:hypothetical protein GCM10020295_82030 [Streptomyces cinereospinus]